MYTQDIFDIVYMFGIFVLGNMLIGFLPVYLMGRFEFIRWPNINVRYIPTYHGSLWGIIMSLLFGYYWTYENEWFYYIHQNYKILVYFFGICGGYLIAQIYYSMKYPINMSD